jgi:MFS family permease
VTARPSVVALFCAFAFAYFFSALLRAVTATLAPIFSAELGLGAADLGLLAGAFFFGFALLQLPLGAALDRFGPKRVLLTLLSVAVLGCVAFAMARGLASLVAARMLIGMGVAACLMAPLTAFRLLLSAPMQLRANAWMLMTGSLGMLASTLPVQWLLPALGWRGLFFGLAGMLALAMVVVWRFVPAGWMPESAGRSPAQPRAASGLGGWWSGYGEVMGHPLFLRLLPMGFFSYGGLVAVQALWAGPWLTQVGGQSPVQAAQGLFIINLAMLFTFAAWGVFSPRLAARGWDAHRLMLVGLPWPLLVMAWIIFLGPQAGAWHWALWCMACTFATPSQVALGQAFEAQQAGRALSAYNLVLFSGIFCVQWGLGLAIDAFVALGWSVDAAFRAAFGLFGGMCLLAYGWFVWPPQRLRRARAGRPE